MYSIKTSGATQRFLRVDQADVEYSTKEASIEVANAYKHQFRRVEV